MVIQNLGGLSNLITKITFTFLMFSRGREWVHMNKWVNDDIDCNL